MPIKKWFKKVSSYVGPGFITGASDDDPSGIGTYSQTGAQFGLSQIWTALFSIPFMITIQEMCGRIGLVTGKGLARIIRERYGKSILYGAVALLLISNTITIGADLGAMAASIELLIPGSFIILLLVITAVTLALEIFVSYRTYAKVLKYFALSLLAYIAAALLIDTDWSEAIAKTLIPHLSLDKQYVLNIVAILGTTISPYLFFWQTNEEVEERIMQHSTKGIGLKSTVTGRRDIRKMRFDTGFGMIFSNTITFFIIATAAGTLGRSGITNITSAAEAAAALEPLAGNFAALLFAAGIVGTGLLAVPVLAGSASYACTEAFNWKQGLYKKFSQAHGFYGIITLATLLGLIINFVGIPPFKMLYYAAILNGVLAPPLLFIILKIATDRSVMGEHTNGRISTILGYAIAFIMSAAAALLLAQTLF